MRLVDRLRARAKTLDGEACAKMAAELEDIRNRRDLLFQLLRLEDGYENVANLAGTDVEALEVISVSSRALTAENRHSFRTAASRYDRFEDLLVADDFANYLAAVRNKASNTDEYGAADRWVAWWVESGWVLCRAVFSGQLSALRSALPDVLTRRVLDLAGVDISGLRSPILVVKESALARLQAQLGHES